MFRQTIIRGSAIARTARPFSTTRVARKDTIDSIKEGAQTAMNTASGIAKDAKAELDKLTGAASKKASEVAGEAQQQGHKVAGQVQGSAAELKGQAKGAAAQAEGHVKGAAAEADRKL